MGTFSAYFWTAFLSVIPVSELRGGIPFAIANNIPWYLAGPFSIVCNVMVGPVCWIFLSTLHSLFYGRTPEKGIKIYKNLFDRFVEKARRRVAPKIEKWGWFGIAVFVGIPLPLTGAWMGTLGAWVLGVSMRRTMLAVVVGVVISGIIVCAVVLTGVTAFDIFIKNNWSTGT